MLLNFRKFIGLLTGSVSLTLIFLKFFFFLFHHSILSWLRIEFHIFFSFYEVIIILKKNLSIGLMLDFSIIYFC